VWDTEHNNGVLIYLLVPERAIELVADRGINACVADSSWKNIVNGLQACLQRGRSLKKVCVVLCCRYRLNYRLTFLCLVMKQTGMSFPIARMWVYRKDQETDFPWHAIASFSRYRTASP
jgi:hypothetical protein